MKKTYILRAVTPAHTSPYQFAIVVFAVTAVLDIVCSISFLFTKKASKLCTETRSMHQGCTMAHFTAAGL